MLFAAVQVADASATLAAVTRIGPAAEGNPILVFGIAAIGAAPALIAAKSVAIMLATAIYVRGLYLAIAVLTVVYVFCAVDAWALFQM